MKKTYINPEITVVRLATIQILASSPDSVNNELGSGTFLSRSADFDEEDW